jgi:hypothetical protein
MNLRTSLVCLVLAFTALSSGCATSAPAQWQSAPVTVGNERLLLEVTEIALRKVSFPVGAGLDPTHLRATSGWKISLAPFKGKGWREQATVQYTRESDGKYVAAVRVERQRNDDIVRPMDLTYAQWESDPDNVERAGVLLHFIQSLLHTGDEVLAPAVQAPAPAKDMRDR